MIQTIIPCIIAGSEITQGDQNTLSSFDGKPIATVILADTGQLRQAKRAVLGFQYEQVTVDAISRVITKAMDLYCASVEEYRFLAQLTGSPMGYLTQSIEEAKSWARSNQTYLATVFGTPQYDHKVMQHTITHQHIRRHIPAGPALAILPRNEEIVPLFVIVQLLLARTPAIIKTSSQGASSYTTVSLFRALLAAAKVLNESAVEAFLHSYSIVALPATEKTRTVELLGVNNATWIVFGSQETVQSVERRVRELALGGRVIGLGTGLSISIVHRDASLEKTAHHVATGACLDRGNKCISTSVCYVHTQVIEEFTRALTAQQQHWKCGDPLSLATRIGVIDTEAQTQYAELCTARGLSSTPITGLTLHPAQAHERVTELPAPIVFIRTFSTDEELLETIRKDLATNGLEKNLVTSIFTAQVERFHTLARQMPAHTIRWNQPTTALSLFMPHQGQYLIEQLLIKKDLDIAAEGLNTSFAASSLKEVVHAER